MSGRNTKTYHGSVFTHNFSQFRGVRDTQAALWEDHRFVPALLNCLSPLEFMQGRSGSVKTRTLSGSLEGVGYDELDRVLCIDGTVSIESR